MGYLYFPDGSVSAVDSDVIKGGLSLGMVAGQLIFGILSDTWGRHKIYGKELLLTIFGTLLVILLPWKGMSTQSVTAWVTIFRVVTGVGIGAGMPCSMSFTFHIHLLTHYRLSTIVITLCGEFPVWHPSYTGIDCVLKHWPWKHGCEYCLSHPAKSIRGLNCNEY